jgi:hypothetical protein
MHVQPTKISAHPGAHLVMAGALVASPFIGACDCTTFGLDPVEQTTGSTTLAETTTNAALTTEIPPTTTTADETTMGVMTGTLTIDPTSTTDEPDTTSSSSSSDESSSGSSGGPPPEAPVLHLEFSAIKQFDFSWSAVAEADLYRILEQENPDANYVQLGADIVGESMSWTMPLHLRHEATYILRACNSGGCTDSAPVPVDDPLVAAIGYFKPNVSDMGDQFGWSVKLSGDGNTLAVSASTEASVGVGVDADPTDNTANNAGAVSVFVRAGSEWSHQQYIKASNTGANDYFGFRVVLSSDGDTMAVSAPYEDGSSTGVGGMDDNGTTNSGAVYVFVRAGEEWMQQAYIKATNTDVNDFFGTSIALSSDGDTLVVGADSEDSGATNVGGDQLNNSVDSAGAVYVYTRTNTVWQYQAYLKASNTDPFDRFGTSVAVSADGNWIAVGAIGEASNATGVAGNQPNDLMPKSGAVYMFSRQNTIWTPQAYIKASNTGANDLFGQRVVLSAAADTLAVGAPGESSNAASDESDDSAPSAGAAYVYVRSGKTWTHQAYIKSTSAQEDDLFGRTLELSASGDLLVVGAVGEDSAALGVSDGQFDDLLDAAGAAYVFVRADGEWAQQAQIKASNTGAGDNFGASMSLTDDGETLAITAPKERSAAVGIDGNQNDNSLELAGACYLF